MKKKPLIVFCILCIYLIPAFAQDTTYYDVKWNLSTASNAAYYRLKTKKDQGWQVRDCYINGKPQMEGAYYDDACKLEQGEFSYYNEKGQRYHICHYIQGNLDGEDTLYYENGQIRTEGIYKNGDEDGIWTGYYPSGKVSARALFKKGKQKEGSFFNEDGSNNKEVNEFSRADTYPGGIPAMQRFIIRNLKYPDGAVNRSIQGMVWIGFNINKDGKMENIHVTHSIEPSLDEEALRVISQMPDWEPLIIGGIVCDSYHEQPINFKLE